MALFDLADVTRTLIFVLEQRIRALAGWPSTLTVSVSPLPPDQLQGDDNLGFYLYHLAEDPHYKNQAAGEPAERAVALNLYYQLTAQVGTESAAAYRAQLLMGAAIRVLHDFPLITDSTTVQNELGVVSRVLEHRGLHGRGNRIRVTLRPVPVDDGVDYWTAGDAPLRLAAYYQVSVILLDSEPIARVPQPVLSYASPVFATGAPQLSGSRATLQIVVGDAPSPSPVVVQPAQVTLGERFTLEGTSLAGVSTALRLRDRNASRVVDSSLWSVVANGEGVQASVSQVLGDSELIPGALNASIIVTRRAGSAVITGASNETPIVITPRLDALSAAGPTLGSAAPGALVAWTGWRFTHADIPSDESDPQSVHLYVGDHALRRGDPAALAPGQYAITGATALSVRLPSDLAQGSVLPVRVGVRSAFSAPRWLGVA